MYVNKEEWTEKTERKENEKRPMDRLKTRNKGE